jgi:hypothetical protein
MFCFPPPSPSHVSLSSASCIPCSHWKTFSIASLEKPVWVSIGFYLFQNLPIPLHDNHSGELSSECCMIEFFSYCVSLSSSFNYTDMRQEEHVCSGVVGKALGEHYVCRVNDWPGIISQLGTRTTSGGKPPWLMLQSKAVHTWISFPYFSSFYLISQTISFAFLANTKNFNQNSSS